MNFVVRIERDAKGAVRGVVERVRTGGKEPFTSIEAISTVISQMIKAEVVDVPREPRRANRTRPARDGRAGR